MTQPIPSNLPEFQDKLEQVKTYYADLLILQYRSKPKARKTVSFMAEEYLGNGLVFQLPTILDVDTAVGANLDLIGKIVGCPRLIYGIENDIIYFSFEKENALGFSTIGARSDGVFKNIPITHLSKYQLNDENYKQLIRFKILKNRLKGAWGNMDEALFEVFGNEVILKNNYNLTITYWLDKNLSLAATAALKLGYLTAPLGIGFNYILAVANPLHVFGMKKISENTGRVGGFSTIGNPANNTFLSIKDKISLTDAGII